MDWDTYPLIPLGGRRSKHDRILYEPFTYCGVTNYTGAWLKRVKMAPATFIGRVTKQGLTPLAALTRPDGKGNCLKPLTDAELAAEKKRLRKKRTMYATGGGIPGYRATIGTDNPTIELGTFDSAAEATYAINAAMARLPEDWHPEDYWEIKKPLSEELTWELNRKVEEALAKHFPERFRSIRLTETGYEPVEPNDDSVVASASES